MNAKLPEITIFLTTNKVINMRARFGNSYHYSLIYKTSGATPLHEASKQGQNYTVKALVSHDKDYLNLLDKNGLTPLHYAAVFSKKSTYNLLLELGANPEIVDSFGRTAAQIYEQNQVEISGNNGCFDSCIIL